MVQIYFDAFTKSDVFWRLEIGVPLVFWCTSEMIDLHYFRLFPPSKEFDPWEWHAAINVRSGDPFYWKFLNAESECKKNITATA